MIDVHCPWGGLCSLCVSYFLYFHFGGGRDPWREKNYESHPRLGLRSLSALLVSVSSTSVDPGRGFTWICTSLVYVVRLYA